MGANLFGMSILKIVLVVFEALLALNLLIFVHELGHFLAARWRGLKVERFAIWFGKPIWSKKINGVEYALGWIPAGGYVSLPQMATMEVIEGKTDAADGSLPNVSPLDKILVAFAGPLFSFLLAVAFALVVWQVGKPTNRVDQEPRIGWVIPGGPAAKAGLRPGDLIVAVDGHPVNSFGAQTEDSVIWRIITSGGTNIALTYVRHQETNTVAVVPTKRKTKWYERKALRQISIESCTDALIGSVLSNSPAARAGLKPGDEIVAVNGEKIYSISAVEQAKESMTNRNAQPITLTVRRGDDTFTSSLLAERPISPTNAPPMFGIAWLQKNEHQLTYPSPWEQITVSANQIFSTVGAIISKHTEIGPQQLGGAVMIIRAYTIFLQSEDGWRWVLWFSVLLNVNLALLNLLPLPVLDGGHILLSVIELVRRKAPSPKLLNVIQSTFAVLLITFMLWIAFYDIGDWIRSGGGRGPAQPVVFAPPH